MFPTERDSLVDFQDLWLSALSQRRTKWSLCGSLLRACVRKRVGRKFFASASPRSLVTPSRNQGVDALLIAAVFGLGIAALHLVSAAAGYPFYRDQHLGTAIEYARHGVDLLRPRIVGFTATDTPVPQELPVWQALAGLALRAGGGGWGWANAVSLFLFFAMLGPFYVLVRNWTTPRIAAWSLAFLLAQPIVILYAGVAGADGWSLAVCVGFLCCADRMLTTGRWGWCGAAAFFAALAAVTKAPFFFAAGITSALMLWHRKRQSLAAWGMLVGIGLFAFLVLLLWAKYGDRQLARAEFLYVDLRLSNPATQRWYFGDWAYRLNPVNWAKGGWMALNSLFGSFALAAFFLWGLIFLRTRLGGFLLAGNAVALLIFSHLILVHRHYYLMFAPAVAVLGAAAAGELLERLGEKSVVRRRGGSLLLMGILLLSAIQGFLGIEAVLNYDPYPRQIAEILRRFSRPDEKLLVVGGGWGGDLFLRSDRRGLSLHDTKPLADPAQFARLRELGYRKLVMVSESPLLHALQVTNPGDARRVRASYRALLTEPAASWPSLLETPDLVIKELPR